MNAVEAHNLSFNYKGAFVFDKLSFSVRKGSFITIVGKGGSGKSTLFKILSGDLKYGGSILILDRSIETSLDNCILGLISPNLDYFKEDVVIDELMGSLNNKGRAFDKIESDIKKISKKIGIDCFLNKKIKNLSIKEKILVQFALQFLLRPKVLVIDNCFSLLDLEKNEVIREVKRVFKKCTVINITNDVNECLFGEEVMFLNDNLLIKKIYELDSENFISNELDVPFMILLSEKLKFYGLTDNVYFNVERLIDDLWE